MQIFLVEKLCEASAKASLIFLTKNISVFGTQQVYLLMSLLG